MSSSTEPTVADSGKTVEVKTEVIEEATEPATQEVTKAVAQPVTKAVTKAVAKPAIKTPDELSLFWRPQEIVFVVVGPEGHKFGIHKDQLCASSAYFKAALQGGFQETVRGEVVLKDTCPTTFGVINEWVYTGKITEKLCKATGPITVHKTVGDKPTYIQLLAVWKLADYLMMPTLQNFVVDMMAARHTKRGITPVEDFQHFYQQTQKGSPMRRFLVDMCVWRFRGSGEEYHKNVRYMSPEMAADIMVALSRRADGPERGPSFVAKKYYVPVKA